MLKSESFTAFFDTFRKVINLEQEKNVILINFLIVSSNEPNNFIFQFFRIWLDLVCPAVDLTTVEHIFQITMVQVDRGELFKLSAKFISELVNDKLEEIFDQIEIIHKNLQKIFNSYFLVIFQLKFQICLTFKLFFMLGIFD